MCNLFQSLDALIKNAKFIISLFIVFFLSSCNPWGKSSIEEITLSLTSPIHQNPTVPGSETPTAFVTRWKTDNPGTLTTSSQIMLPLSVSGTYNFVVDWGDGTSDTITTWNAPEKIHTYTTPGEYVVSMTGTITQLSMYTPALNALNADANKLIDVIQFGNNPWLSMHTMFTGAVSLTTWTATDTPNLSQTTDMFGMFLSASAFNQNIGNWNTSNVTNMSYMFYNASAFNQNIGNWNTANVTNMSGMFTGASAFNQNIGNWNTANVTNMSGMFRNASAFNQNIGNWNTSNVTNMSGMFYNASAFNQNIGNWNTANVTNMAYMFYNASAFNQNIGNWNTSNVTNMSGMFSGASAFNQNLTTWSVNPIVTSCSFFKNNGAWNQIPNFTSCSP
ncbi:MAG: BspA family leucine-rich repeat surface protein [Pseudobdellovibrio sp.]